MTQPLHPSQTMMKGENGWFIFKFQLVPTPEFIATLLGWADQIEVLKPAKFRREFSNKIEKMMLLYRAKLAATG